MSLKRAITAIQKHYPIRYAESSWDNTGLLLDSSTTQTATTININNPLSILLTIDLTKTVVEEALKHKVQLIIAYHPFIFRGIKKIEPTSNPQHDSLIKLIGNGISVYSPHTAVDAAKGGVNDWLVDVVASQVEIEKREVIDPNSEDGNVGMGRIVTLKDAKSIKEVINSVKQGLEIDHVQLATTDSNKNIKTIAICAGSGSGVFSKLSTPADLYLTGELSHHEALYLKELGSVVICTNHSNSERGYLKVMREKLLEELDDVAIVISKEDVDPYSTV